MLQSFTRIVKQSLAGLALSSLFFSSAFAGNHSVSVNTDNVLAPPANSLRAAIIAANADPDDAVTISFSAILGGDTIALAGPLPPISIGTGLNKSLSIDGAGAPGLSIDGQGFHAIFFIQGSTEVNISTLTLENGRSQGGTGGASADAAGAGGGLGAGGAIFVSDGKTTITDVLFTGNAAQGGAGGASGGPGGQKNGGGGGGMLLGTGGSAVDAANHGGAGGGGLNAVGGNSGVVGLPGILTSGSAGGAGGNGAAAGFAGGIAAGGGGGGPEGGGGRCGGGGGGGSGGALAGFGGGNAGAGVAVQGEGGSGFGGAVFVRDGAEFIAKTSVVATNYSGGAAVGGAGSNAGVASGTGLYFDTNTIGIFDVAGAGQTVTDSIGGAGGLTKRGSGVLTLVPANDYTGNTLIETGRLIAQDVGSVSATVENGGILEFALAAPGTYSGVITDRTSPSISGQLVKSGGNALDLNPAGTNTFTGGVTISGGTLQLSSLAALNSSNSVVNNGIFLLGGGVLTYEIQDLIGSGDVQLSQATLAFGTAADINYTGLFSTAIATGSLRKQGTGKFTLSGSGASTFATGGLDLQEGSFVVAGSSTFDDIGIITLGANTTYQWNSTGAVATPPTSITSTTNNGASFIVSKNFTSGFPVQNVDNVTNDGGAYTITGGYSAVTPFKQFRVNNSATTETQVDFDVASTATLTVSGAGSTFHLNGGNLVNAGTVVVENGATVTRAAAETFLNNNDLYIASGASVVVPIDGSGSGTSKLFVDGTVSTGDVISGVAQIDVRTGTFTVNHAVTGFGTGFTVFDGATTTLTDAAAANFDMSNNTVNVLGTLNMAPNFNIVGTGGSVLNINNGFELGSAGNPGTVDLVGTININSGATNINVAPTNFGLLNIENNGIVVLKTDLALSVNAQVTNKGVLDLNGNNITGLNATTLRLESDFRTNTPGIVGGGLIDLVRTIELDNAAATFTIDTAPTNFDNFTNTAGTVLLNTDLPVVGDLVNAGTFNMNNHNMTVGNGIAVTNTGIWSTSGTVSEIAAGYTFAVGNGGVFTVNNPVSGYTSFTVDAGGTTTVNTGGSVADVISNGVLNYNGGTISGNISGAGTMNINGQFSPTVGQTITAQQFIINPGGLLDFTVQVNGNLTNSGTLRRGTIGTQNVLGNFTLNADGKIVLALSDSPLGTSALINVFGTTTLNGGTVDILLPDGGALISDQEEFTVIKSPNLAINPVLPIVDVPTKIFFAFTPKIVNNDLVLVAKRKTFKEVNTNPVLEGVSGALDELAQLSITDPSITDTFPILGIIGGQTSVENVEALYNQLIPDEVNGGLFANSIVVQNLVLEKIIGRLDALRLGFNSVESGLNAGDVIEGRGSYGPMIFGNSVRQSGRGGLSGYSSDTSGFGFFADAPMSDVFRLGGAISYARSRVQRLDHTENVTVVQNVQTMVYGSLQYRNLFLDGLFSYGYNMYRGRRNLPIIDSTAMSRYRSSQFGGKVQSGFSIPLYSVEISPTAAVQFAHVNRATYQEAGPRGAGLEVSNRQASTVQLALGGKLVNISESDDFLPELHVFYLHDLKQSKLEVTSKFLNGGSAFVSEGPKLPKGGVNVGLNITSFLSESTLVELGYDLYLKRGFTSQSASFKFRWIFE